MQSLLAGGAVFIGLLAPLAALDLLVIILVAGATGDCESRVTNRSISGPDRRLDLPEKVCAYMLIISFRPAPGPTASTPRSWA